MLFASLLLLRLIHVKSLTNTMNRYKFLLFILLFHTLNVLALKPIRFYEARPCNYNLIYKEVVFPTSDSVHLKGSFLPAQHRVNTAMRREELKQNKSTREYKLKDEAKRPTLIICDGDAGNMLYNIWLANEFIFNDFNVFLFDWRGFGESEDWPINEKNLVYTEFIRDYHAAIDFVIRQPEVDSSNIFLFGYSTGAYLSWIVALQRNDIRKVIGRGLMTDFNDFFKELSKIKDTSDIIIPQDFPVYLLPKYSASFFKTPCFLIVGANDDRTPVWMSKEIYSKLKAEKKLWVVNKALHGGSKAPEVLADKQFFKRARRFLINSQ